MERDSVSRIEIDFNPRSLAGATVAELTQPGFLFLFQSTLPRGSDQIFRTLQASIRDFNPRSLAGATRADLTYQQGINNFNPRSLAGATFALVGFLMTFGFQSTLPRGSDRQPALDD